MRKIRQIAVIVHTTSPYQRKSFVAWLPTLGRQAAGACTWRKTRWMAPGPAHLAGSRRHHHVFRAEIHGGQPRIEHSHGMRGRRVWLV